MGSSQGYGYVESKGLNTISNGVWRWVEIFCRSDRQNSGLMELLRLTLHTFESRAKRMAILDIHWGNPT